MICRPIGLGGIPSHAHLAHRFRYTPMDTDFIDKVNGVWGKVFVNLADFGRVAPGRLCHALMFRTCQHPDPPCGALGSGGWRFVCVSDAELRSTTRIADRGGAG